MSPAPLSDAIEEKNQALAQTDKRGWLRFMSSSNPSSTTASNVPRQQQSSGDDAEMEDVFQQTAVDIGKTSGRKEIKAKSIKQVFTSALNLGSPASAFIDSIGLQKGNESKQSKLRQLQMLVTAQKHGQLRGYGIDEALVSAVRLSLIDEFKFKSPTGLHPLMMPEILDIIFSYLEAQNIMGMDPNAPIDFVKADSIKYTITRPRLHPPSLVCKLWNVCAAKYLWKNVKIGKYENVERLAYSLSSTSLDLVNQLPEFRGVNFVTNSGRGFEFPLPIKSPMSRIIHGNFIRSIALIPPHTNSGVAFENWNIDFLVAVIALTCPKLEELNLSNCTSLTDVPMTLIAKHCPNMRKLNLNRCDTITDSSLLAIAENLKKLELLNLCRPLLKSKSQVSDLAIQAVLKSNCGIQELRLRNCDKTSDHTLLTLGKYIGKSLLAVDLSWCINITDFGIINGFGQGKCTNLVSIALNGCKNLTDNAIHALLTNCPSIQSLSLAHLPAIQDSVMINFAQQLKNLRMLSLNGCGNIRDPSIVAIAKNCPELESISMFSLDITDASVVSIAQYCPKLKSLSISGCSKVTDEGASKISKLNLLTSLYLNGASITDQSIMHITRRCHNIRALSLNECTQLTDQTAYLLAKYCRGVQSLSLNRCAVTTVGVKIIADYCRDLREVSLKECELVELEGPKAMTAVTGNSSAVAGISAVGAQVHRDLVARRVAVITGKIVSAAQQVANTTQ